MPWGLSLLVMGNSSAGLEHLEAVPVSIVKSPKGSFPAVPVETTQKKRHPEKKRPTYRFSALRVKRLVQRGSEVSNCPGARRGRDPKVIIWYDVQT